MTQTFHTHASDKTIVGVNLLDQLLDAHCASQLRSKFVDWSGAEIWHSVIMENKDN